MDDIQNYTLITTIAVSLLVLSQVVFVIVLIAVLAKINKIASNVKQTSAMSKAFLQSLREEQLRRVSLWQLGLFAFKRAQSLRRK